MSDDKYGPSTPEPDSSGPDLHREDDEPTQPISGPSWTSPSQSHPAAADRPPSRGPDDRPIGHEHPDSGAQPGLHAGAQPSPQPGLHAGPVSPVPAQPSPWGPRPGPAPMPSAYSAAPTTPMPVSREQPAKARVPGWVWPVVAALSLLLGLTGGFLGALGYDQLDDGPSRFDGGLESVQTRNSAPLDADNGSIAAVAEELLPSTVQILAAFEGEDEGATGSGFVLDREGHVVTNNHVVAAAAEDDGPIKVVDSLGVRHDATVVGRSTVYDLAILLVDDPAGLQPAALGSSSVLRVGDPVIAFGSPLGLSQTVTSGIVSAMDRPVTTGDAENIASYINAVQTDAAINPGNSGGPLVNLAGEVVGVNSAIATAGGGGLGGGSSGNIGVGFAIPMEQVRITADQILRTGEARYPVIGAKVQTGGPGSSGANIDEVNEGSPAEAAGLRKDDVVTEVEGKLVADGIALIVAIRTHQPGDTIEFTIMRDGAKKSIEITLDGEVG
ncbi:S1C family serine protease [Nocardioides sp.]|uniref:S1C family serine protease n=1 Tax=Nocardioides sp. TaxID=35761 RepID=UPI002CF52BD6|nr:trypsin-like peptidase domain-containing protein [Nocardioides sp.]HXH81253.1 trypsin-like peptidase domain-containing protein [Nocardioides sp.]